MLNKTFHLSKAIIAFCVAIFCLMVGYDNLIDFNSNYGLVNKVLSMSGMPAWFDPSPIASRAITDPSLQLLFYIAIIAGEITAGVIMLVASLIMLRNVSQPSFQLGQSLYIMGTTVALLIWYLGFAIIASEWFAMWASSGTTQMKAYSFSTFILLSMCYVMLPSEKIQ
ncbi:MAG: DUF2165 family protein [Parashewanella sp.]